MTRTLNRDGFRCVAPVSRSGARGARGVSGRVLHVTRGVASRACSAVGRKFDASVHAVEAQAPQVWVVSAARSPEVSRGPVCLRPFDPTRGDCLELPIRGHPSQKSQGLLNQVRCGRTAPTIPQRNLWETETLPFLTAPIDSSEGESSACRTDQLPEVPDGEATERPNATGSEATGAQHIASESLPSPAPMESASAVFTYHSQRAPSGSTTQVSTFSA